MSQNLENTLQVINQKKIKLNDALVARNNELLMEFITSFITQFKKDAFFKSIFERYFFGGSFYDGLKVGSPNEFDIDVVFTLPVLATPKVICDDDHPGYVQVQMLTLKHLITTDYDPSYEDMLKKIVNDDHFLSIRKIMSWFQSMVDTSMNALSFEEYKIIKKSPKQSGPAITFKIQDRSGEYIDIDFVPCFKFSSIKDWPKNIRKGPHFPNADKDQLTHEFLVVPKSRGSDTYLRLSFQGQERRIIHDIGYLKPAIRLLKLYRDTYNDGVIKSYFLKTVALWALEDPNFRYKNESLSSIFLQLFEKLIKVAGDRKLCYYWNKDFNLLSECNSLYAQDLHNRLNKHLVIFKSGNSDMIMKIFQVPVSEHDSTIDTVQLTSSGVVLFAVGVAAVAGIIGLTRNYRNGQN